MNGVVTLARAAGVTGEVVLRRRTDGTGLDELIVNGVFAMDSADSTSERELARLGTTTGTARVLVGGLGLGYTVAALCGLPLRSIEVVEIESCLCDWARGGLTATWRDILADPRVRLVSGDVRRVLSGSQPELRGPWDSVLLDVDNGPDFLISDRNVELYSAAGLRQALSQLTTGGILAIWCEAASPQLHARLAESATEVQEHLLPTKRARRSLPYAIYTARRD